ncbi:MAG: flagellar brake protein [Bacillota bacterium]|nr:flagellar brake protein [Bacillota bacterium]
MEIKNLLHVNMHLYVYDQKNQVYYQSTIQEIGKDHIALGAPVKKQKQMFLQEGETYSFRLPVADALYSFKSKILGKKFNGYIPLYLISLPEDVERRQRRQFFRFPCMMDLQYWVLSEQGFKNGDQPSHCSDTATSLSDQVESLGLPEKAVVINISGGGLMFVSRRRLTVGAVLALRFRLESRAKSTDALLKGKVMRVFVFYIGKVVRYRYGIEFFDINERTRDEIIRFVFTLSRDRILE